MKASTYTMTKDMSLEEIVKVLESGNSYNPDVISITFKEGEWITDYAKEISTKTKNSYEDTIIDKYYDHAVSIAKLSASVLDGDKIEEYVVNGVETDGYQEDLERLNNIKEETNAYYVYVMYPYTKEEVQNVNT